MRSWRSMDFPNGQLIDRSCLVRLHTAITSGARSAAERTVQKRKGRWRHKAGAAGIASKFRSLAPAPRMRLHMFRLTALAIAIGVCSTINCRVHNRSEPQRGTAPSQLHELRLRGELAEEGLLRYGLHAVHVQARLQPRTRQRRLQWPREAHPAAHASVGTGSLGHLVMSMHLRLHLHLQAACAALLGRGLPPRGTRNPPPTLQASDSRARHQESKRRSPADGLLDGGGGEAAAFAGSRHRIARRVRLEVGLHVA